MFVNRKFTKTPVNQSAGKKLSSDALKGRVFEVNLGDLNGHGSLVYKKIKLIVDDASETNTRTALTNFYGMDTTKDHLCSLIKKWYTLIEATVDAKTNDGFILRFFPIAFTKRGKGQQKATTYAQRSQVKQIRKKMVDVITKQVNKTSLKELIPLLLTEKIPTEITEAAKKVFPIGQCIIRKVKTLKRPRFDISQLLSIHSDVVGITEAKNENAEESTSGNLLK
jgi:small subunit ribosomal protein S3Ae